MLKYLVIQLDDTSVSFCHYNNTLTERKLMPLDVLKNGIIWAMKENLMIQFVFPDYTLPEKYLELIDTVDHSTIKPVDEGTDADVIVAQSWADLDRISSKDASVVIRTSKKNLFENYLRLVTAISETPRLNVVITDIHKFSESDFDTYKNILEQLLENVKDLYVNGKYVQLNILTDRMLMEDMNNCNAGCESITLAPDGKFYVCPAFYLESDGYSVGDLITGLDIKNQQLYRLDHAPICRKCDAYQCRRCVWLNRKTTLEVNTPSHEQCVVSHLERNASKQLLESLRSSEVLSGYHDIPEISYLDPFDIIKK